MAASILKQKVLANGLRWFGKSELSLVVLPSHACFFLPSESPTGRRAEELVYKLENELPVDAEAMSFTFIQAARKTVGDSR
ncbi:MAG: hypothetical protein R3C53_19365 [Pirellulaceae bacterium]